MKTLVIGASVNPDRYSYKAIVSLLNHNHEVIAIGNKSGNVLSVTIDTSFISISNLHTVTLYLNPERQKTYYQYIIDLKPERVIFNPGTENNELYQLLDQNNIAYEVACTLVLLATNQF
jgi:uncharacterized protein